MELPKGIYFNKRFKKYVAQFWDTNTKHNKILGSFDTIEKAVLAREEFITNHLLYNGQILKKVRKYPKGIRFRSSKTKGDRYDAEVNILWGKNKDKMETIYIGTFNELDEAIEARKEFILKLL